MPVLTAWSTPGAALLVTAGAGVLTRFAFDAFLSLRTQGLLVGLMGLAYLAGRRAWPPPSAWRCWAPSGAGWPAR